VLCEASTLTGEDAEVTSSDSSTTSLIGISSCSISATDLKTAVVQCQYLNHFPGINNKKIKKEVTVMVVTDHIAKNMDHAIVFAR